MRIKRTGSVWYGHMQMNKEVNDKVNMAYGANNRCTNLCFALKSY